jgi:hypothetical protein
MSSGPGYALSTSTPPGWSAQQIIYYQLSMASMPGVHYIFESGSGIVTSDINISAFIASVVAGSPAISAGLPSGQTPPNLTVTVPCFVVVQLDSGINWAFQPGVAPMLTQDSLSTKYTALNLVDASGNVYAATAPSSPSCLIMYFTVVSVSPASDNVSDPFSFYFQFTQSGGDTYDVVLDPMLKNKGPG